MPLLLPLGLVSTLMSGAIFGFFYAWVCSTMWGLDATDPRVAIEAMQAMNASVRNAVFAPAFFGTPFVLVLTGIVAWRSGVRGAALAFGAGGIVYLLGGMILTMTINVPMNEALARIEVPDNIAGAAAIWEGYSPRWQVWNTARTCVSGASLFLSATGLYLIGRARA